MSPAPRIQGRQQPSALAQKHLIVLCPPGTAAASISPVPAWRMSLRTTLGTQMKSWCGQGTSMIAASHWPAAPWQAWYFQGQLTPPVIFRTGPTIPGRRTGASAVQPPPALTTRDNCPCQPPLSHINPKPSAPRQIPYHVRSIKHGSEPGKKYLRRSPCSLSSGLQSPDALSVRAASTRPSALSPP